MVIGQHNRAKKKKIPVADHRRVDASRSFLDQLNSVETRNSGSFVSVSSLPSFRHFDKIIVCAFLEKPCTVQPASLRKQKKRERG